MTAPRIHQFHSGSAVGDAVTNSMFYIQDLLTDAGVASDIFVEHLDPRLGSRLGSILNFRPKPDDVLLIHHSMGHDIMPLIEGLRCRKVLIYHNVTPPSFFEAGSVMNRYTRKGLALLSNLRSIVSAAAADSEFNAEELRLRGFDDVAVIPALKDFAEIRNRPHNPEPYYFSEPRYQLLFVGRICENKGQLHLLRFLDQYRDSFAYPIHLTLVGHADHGEAYAANLRRFIVEAGLQARVTITGHVSDADLYGHYRAADAYVSYSEHEGFGVPLLEAMVFDTPVVAYASSAVAGTLGTAGLKLATTDPAELFAQLRQVFTDRASARAVIAGQRLRLADFSRERVAARLIAFLEPYLPSRRMTRQPVAVERSKHRRYVIEGPCETSYSLALVNRNLALAFEKSEGVDASLLPAEGWPGYKLNPEGLRAHPEISSLIEPPALNAGQEVVWMRNMYPLRPAGMLGDWRLANLAWEESELPSKDARLFNRYLDGMLAPTSFNKRVFRNSGVRLPIAVYGHGGDHLHRAGSRPRERNRFVFLHVSSGMARKGIEDLFFSYVAAFKASDPVELIVKSHHNVNNIVMQTYNRLIVGNPQAPAVTLLFEDISEFDMGQLYAFADALVLPTRGEGFNLPALEAMRIGLPVITTGYSGHMDFCSEETARLVDFDFEPAASHLAGFGSMWAVARTQSLALQMRRIVSDHGTEASLQQLDRARKVANSMTWEDSASRVDAFVDRLKEMPVEARKLKLAWVSTWNTRCGIATYSEFLVSHLLKDWLDVGVFANHQPQVRLSEPFVNHKFWTHREQNLEVLTDAILAGGYDAAVFQYNYGFHTLKDLASAVERLEAGGVSVYVFFHKTEPVMINGELESIALVADALGQATRLVVHAVDDVNRLKSFGLVDNVVKIPHGAFNAQDVDRVTMRRLLGLKVAGPVIASYGFLLPGKGLPELIVAFGQLVARYPEASLVMVNSTFPDPVSDQEHKACLDLIGQLGLSDRVTIVHQFLENEESMMLLQASDVIVFAYQQTGESASGAVRQGLSALRPILTTPLPIFDDVGDCVHRASGIRPNQIAAGIETLLSDADLCGTIVAAQQAWLENHDWRRIGERLSNLIIGLHQDRHGTILMPDSLSRPDASDVQAHDVEQTDYPDESWFDSLGDEVFVRSLYQRTLGRDIAAHELTSLLQMLDSGTLSRSEMVCQVEISDEARSYLRDSHHSVVLRLSDLHADDSASFIRQLYTKLLRRMPDAVSQANAVDLLDNGRATRKDFVSDFVNSKEFTNNNFPIRIILDA